MKIYFTLLLFFLFLFESLAITSENTSQNEFSDFNQRIYEKYIKMDNQLKFLAESSVKKILPFLVEARENLNISSSCIRNIFDMVMGLRKLTKWSFNFLDSMGKIQSGLATGNFIMFGEYEECTETSVMKNRKVEYEGQYCLVACKPYLPKVKKIPGVNGKLEDLVNATRNASDFMKILVSKAQIFYAVDVKLGVCIPSGCTKEDLSEIIKYSIGEYVNSSVSYCLKKGDLYFWNTKRSIIVSIFVLLGIIIITSTLLDNILESWKKNKLGFKSKILQCFSLTRNFPKLMSTEVSEKSITCFHGIRVLTIFWIILGHEYFFIAMTKSINHAMNYEKMLNNFFSQIVLNGFVSVEMFFFMSGFLNCYMRIHKREVICGLGNLKIIAHRLWRIYPAYIAALLLMYLLTQPQPFYYDLQKEFTGYCDQYWWRNMLFINNFFPPNKMCLAQSWFICVDMQLFLLTLFTIPVLSRKPKLGIILHIVIILIVNFSSMTIWFVNYVAPSALDGTRLDLSESMRSLHIYFQPFVHVGPYIVGILVGYVMATKKKFEIPKIVQLSGWIVASLFFLSMLFLTLKWNSGIPYTHLESALYGAWSRTFLVLGFSWLVFCCVNGQAGLFNYILSLNVWVPLSRITYMVYLLSPIIQTHNLCHLSFPDDFSDMKIIWNYFADLSISILLSFAVVLMVESPVIAMEKLLLHRKVDQSLDSPKESTATNIRKNRQQESGWQINGKITTIHL